MNHHRGIFSSYTAWPRNTAFDNFFSKWLRFRMMASFVMLPPSSFGKFFKRETNEFKQSFEIWRYSSFNFDGRSISQALKIGELMKILFCLRAILVAFFLKVQGSKHNLPCAIVSLNSLYKLNNVHTPFKEKGLKFGPSKTTHVG